MKPVDPILLTALVFIARKKKKTRLWVHPINKARRRLGEYHRLVQELRLDNERFYRYFRMSSEKFDLLLSKVGPKIQRKGSNFQSPLCPSQRLAITLR